MYPKPKDLTRILKREASKTKPQPFIPVGFSGKEFINRLRHNIEEMNFCPKRIVHSWVDYSDMIVIQAPPGTDCSQACSTKGLTCNAEMFSYINQKRFLTTFWPKCKNIIKITSRSYWSLGYPAINGQNCILQVIKYSMLSISLSHNLRITTNCSVARFRERAKTEEFVPARKRVFMKK